MHPHPHGAVRKGRQTGGDRQGGFALPSVLLVVAIVSIALWSALSVLDQASASLRDIRERQSLQLAGATAEARVAFLLASEPLGPFGLRIDGQRVYLEEFGSLRRDTAPEPVARNERLLRFDGSAYAMPVGAFGPRATQRGAATDAGDVLVRLQDRAGLYDLDTANPLEVERLLRSLGVAEPAARRLADSLADFTDADDLTRLNGAERSEYREAGLPGPDNQPLDRPVQALRAYGWSQSLDALQVQRFLDISFIGPMVRRNVNTAPLEVLRAWFWQDDAGIARILEARSKDETLPSDMLPAAAREMMADYDLNPSFALPDRAVRLRVMRQGQSSRVFECVIEMQPAGSQRPFFVTDRSVKTLPKGLLAGRMVETVPGRPVGRTPARGGDPKVGDGGILEFPISQSVLSWRGGGGAQP